MNVMVYVDGFNLYYGAVKDTRYKWLNIQRMAQLLLPKDQIVGIKYFTAKVHSRDNDPDKHIRQQVYLRALRTLPNFKIYYGHYLSHVVWMRLANPVPGRSKYAEVIKTEEKGSDVNLAVQLLNDGYQSAYELAVIVTNDSDLLEAIRIVQGRLKLGVGIINPQEYPSVVLRREAQFIKQIRGGVLAAAQFPPEMMDANGKFHKPDEW